MDRVKAIAYRRAQLPRLCVSYPHSPVTGVALAQWKSPLQRGADIAADSTSGRDL